MTESEWDRQRQTETDRDRQRQTETDRDRPSHKELILLIILLTACVASRQIMGQWKNTSILLASMQGGGKN
jgi:hypothetical protein